MGVLESYEPREVLQYFEEICAIPHGSGNVKQISDYCVEFAHHHNLEVYQDAMHNVIIIKEACKGYEDVPPVIIQGHMDMVCEKTLDSPIDFQKDGLDLRADGEWIWAHGTTLGGDDGIAIAMALAILASDTWKHPRIEAVFTVDEEVGLLGAAGIDLSMLKGKRMINIDSEEEGVITVGCAGGLTLTGRIPITFEKSSGVSCRVTVSGMLGGHSGCDIHKEHGNSNLVMGRVLHAAGCRMNIGIAAMSGGSKDNVIPRHTEATVVVGMEDAERFENIIKEQSCILSREYAASDPGIEVTCTCGKEDKCSVLTKQSYDTALNALMNLPNGIQHWSKDVEGLVETSLNMGVMVLDESQLILRYSVRSSKATAKVYLARRAIAMIEYMGGTTEIDGDYPAWEYKNDSAIRDIFVQKYEELFGSRPRIEAIHAGLECGLIADKVEGLDCVSIGPDIRDIHTCAEKLSVPSTKRIWDLLIKVLETK